MESQPEAVTAVIRSEVIRNLLERCKDVSSGPYQTLIQEARSALDSIPMISMAGSKS